MRQFGIITNIEINNITIAIYNKQTDQVLPINITNYDKTYPYEIMYIIQYNSENKSITPITNHDFNKEEKEQLLQIFKNLIEQPHLNQIFLEQLDSLLTPNNNHKK